MTLEELKTLLQETHWFERLCEPAARNGCVQVLSLAPWANIPTCDAKLEEIADQMDWLPSSREQEDPIHGESLEERSKQLGKTEEYFSQSLDIYKTAMASLRKFDGHAALKVGPHDFTEAARGAALFASRRAAYEILLADGDFWCSVMSLYGEGHWPCGILPNGVVVFL